MHVHHLLQRYLGVEIYVHTNVPASQEMTTTIADRMMGSCGSCDTIK